MKITAIKSIIIKNSCPLISDALSTSTERKCLIVKIETDSDISGIGEAFLFGCSLYAGKKILEDQLTPLLLGEDPCKIEYIWYKMYWNMIAYGRNGLIQGLISGVDIALWDILGKVANLPIYKLLGAHSDKVPSYACGGYYAKKKNLEILKEELESYKRKGYESVKIKIGRNPERPENPLKYKTFQENGVSFETDLMRIKLAREVFPDGVLIVDTNASWDYRTFCQYGNDLLNAGISWVEEPIPFEDLDGLKKVSELLGAVQIAGFETAQGLETFQALIQTGCVGIVQADVGWAGGISAVRKIGQLALANHKKISLHSFGSAIHFAASLHLAASMSNTEMIESEENPNVLRSGITTEPFSADNKMNFFVPEGPGLGIQLDFEKIEQISD